MKNLTELNRMLELAGRPLLESTDDKIKELKTKLKNKMLSDCDIKAYEDELVKLEKEAVTESIDSDYEVGDTVKINGDMHTLSYDDDNDIWWATSNDGHEVEFYPGMEDTLNHNLNESTTAVVGKQLGDGTIYATSVNFDGYPGALGKLLQNHYSNPGKLEDAIEQGAASSWSEDEIDSYRGRGESDKRNSPRIVNQLSDLDTNVNYYYLLTPNGWMYGTKPDRLSSLDNAGIKKIAEWGNSIDSRYDDTGTISDQPDGEIVDNSLRRYLDAIPNKVSVQERIKTCDMLKEYSEYKVK